MFYILFQEKQITLYQELLKSIIEKRYLSPKGSFGIKEENLQTVGRTG